MLNQPDLDVATELAALREQVARLAPSKPLDSDDLMNRGYSEKEAYGLLRRHGVRLPGAKRIRIAVTVLEAIERGERPA